MFISRIVRKGQVTYDLLSCGLGSIPPALNINVDQLLFISFH
jgi:hypothetical protein